MVFSGKVHIEGFVRVEMNALSAAPNTTGTSTQAINIKVEAQRLFTMQPEEFPGLA